MYDTNLRISFKLRKTPIGLTDRSFRVFFIRFFDIILSSRQESPVGAGGLPIDLSMNTTATKDDEGDNGTEDDRHNAVWLPTNSQYTPAMEPRYDGPNAQHQLLHFQVRPSRECGEWASGSHCKSKYEHRNDGFAYKGDNDGDDAEE